MAVKYLVDKLAAIRKQETVDASSHVWDDYQLSAEVIAMAPAKRKSIYGDYDADIILTRDSKGFNEYDTRHITAEDFLNEFLEK